MKTRKEHLAIIKEKYKGDVRKYLLSMGNFKEDLKKINRVEIIDKALGRTHIFWNNHKIQLLSLQDGGRTLKVFVDKK